MKSKIFDKKIIFWESKKVYLRTEKTRAIFPIALILVRITSLRADGTPPEKVVYIN